jgi:hypothetical protein
MPKAEYVTWKGQRFEGSGIKPDTEVAWQPSVGAPDIDNQLEHALWMQTNHGE